MADRINTPFTNEHFADWCQKMVGQPYWYGTCVYLTAQLKTVIDRMWAWFNLPGNFGTKKKAILLSTARGTDYSMTLDQYGIYSKYMGWEDLGHILGIGKETEARALGASIQ